MRPVAGLFILPVLLAAGCATAPPTPVEDPAAAWQARQSELRPVTFWSIQGRLAMRAADQGWHARLNWERDGQRHRMDFTGPLGRGHLRLVQDSDGAELRDADQRTWRAENAEQILYRATGWLLPLEGLNYWILGLPTPASVSHQQLDPQGRLKTLIQSGWNIEFLEYARYGAFDLPVKMYVKRQMDRAPGGAAAEGILEVRLSIERWAFKQ